MLSHSQQQDEAQARMASAAAHLLVGASSPIAGGGSGSSSSSHNNITSSDLAMKIQQVQSQVQHKQQMDMLSKLMNANMHSSQQQQQQQSRTSPLPDMNVQLSRELLNRPEAQAILRGNFYFI